DAHPLVVTEDPPQRYGDLTRRERPGGHLIAQGLEQVVVVPVDESDVDVRLPERLDRLEAPEPSTDDDTTATTGCGHAPVSDGHSRGVKCRPVVGPAARERPLGSPGGLGRAVTTIAKGRWLSSRH